MSEPKTCTWKVIELNYPASSYSYKKEGITIKRVHKWAFPGCREDSTIRELPSTWQFCPFCGNPIMPRFYREWRDSQRQSKPGEYDNTGPGISCQVSPQDKPPGQ